MKEVDSTNSTSGDNSHMNLETPPRAERRNTRGSRQRGVDSVTKKFLRNFDPEHSEREKRKLHRRLYQGHKRHALYNENGVHMQTGDDLCDCLNSNCAGCHFLCPKCSSPKCGHECRNHRKWTYESIENEGSDIVTKNPLLKDT
ncbi:ARL14 effector protein [Calliopsis andreniformis]|uniref:ARL14 effector protein n=1 Tax=Calliopsis andreniformis TaxID=337506 RepID=UPI003FCCE001